MSRKHHAIYSDPTGAAAAASPAKRRPSRAQGPEAPETSSSAPARAAKPDGVDRETVARLAYSYWEARGFTGGSAEEDWLRAERELLTRVRSSAIA